MKEKETAFKTTRTQLKDVWIVACSRWQERIESFVDTYGEAFSEEIALPKSIVDEMYLAAGSNCTQLDALDVAFPTYRVKEDRNALKPLSPGTLEWDKVDRLLVQLSEAWRRDADYRIFYLTNGLAGTKTNLVGRSIAIPSWVEIKLHEGVGGCTLIELVEK